MSSNIGRPIDEWLDEMEQKDKSCDKIKEALDSGLLKWKGIVECVENIKRTGVVEMSDFDVIDSTTDFCSLCVVFWNGLYCGDCPLCVCFKSCGDRGLFKEISDGLLSRKDIPYSDEIIRYVLQEGGVKIIEYSLALRKYFEDLLKEIKVREGGS